MKPFLYAVMGPDDNPVPGLLEGEPHMVKSMIVKIRGGKWQDYDAAGYSAVKVQLAVVGKEVVVPVEVMEAIQIGLEEACSSCRQHTVLKLCEPPPPFTSKCETGVALTKFNNSWRSNEKQEGNMIDCKKLCVEARLWVGCGGRWRCATCIYRLTSRCSGLPIYRKLVECAP